MRDVSMTRSSIFILLPYLECLNAQWRSLVLGRPSPAPAGVWAAKQSWAYLFFLHVPYLFIVLSFLLEVLDFWSDMHFYGSLIWTCLSDQDMLLHLPFLQRHFWLPTQQWTFVHQHLCKKPAPLHLRELRRRDIFIGWQGWCRSCQGKMFHCVQSHGFSFVLCHAFHHFHYFHSYSVEIVLL